MNKKPSTAFSVIGTTALFAAPFASSDVVTVYLLALSAGCLVVYWFFKAWEGME